MPVPAALLSSEDSTRETPRWLAHVLNQEFQFNLDACASSDNTISRAFLDEKMNALEWDWRDFMGWPISSSLRVFMNPPWGNTVRRSDGGKQTLYDFVEKAALESSKGCLVVCLLPSKTETRWFQDFAWKASEVRFFDRRIHYEKDGKLPTNPKDPSKLSGATLASCLFVFRPSRGVIGPTRFCSMSGDPKTYGEEAVRLWQAAKPETSSSTTRRARRVVEDTTPGTQTTEEPESPLGSYSSISDEGVFPTF